MWQVPTKVRGRQTIPLPRIKRKVARSVEDTIQRKNSIWNKQKEFFPIRIRSINLLKVF